jgi:hypothetical protein
MSTQVSGETAKWEMQIQSVRPGRRSGYGYVVCVGCKEGDHSHLHQGRKDETLSGPSRKAGLEKDHFR